MTATYPSMSASEHQQHSPSHHSNSSSTAFVPRLTLPLYIDATADSSNNMSTTTTPANHNMNVSPAHVHNVTNHLSLTLPSLSISLPSSESNDGSETANGITTYPNGKVSLNISLLPSDASSPSMSPIAASFPGRLSPRGTLGIHSYNSNAAAGSPRTLGAIGSAMQMSSTLSPRSASLATAKHVALLSPHKRLAFYNKQCTSITDYLYVSGKAIAADRAALLSHGITHIINCVGDVCQNYFEGDFYYLRLHLLDYAGEDIMCILYPVIEFIDAARASNHRTLIHCQQGVSRSCILCIAYLMLRENMDYEDAFTYVRARRGICRPNVGFMCQLIAWRKRCIGQSASGLSLYRIAHHCVRDRTIVAKWCDHAVASSLDERGMFVLHSPEVMFIWIGEKCTESRQEMFLPHAYLLIARLQKYEHAPSRVEIIYQADEAACMQTTNPSIFRFPNLESPSKSISSTPQRRSSISRNPLSPTSHSNTLSTPKAHNFSSHTELNKSPSSPHDTENKQQSSPRTASSQNSPATSPPSSPRSPARLLPRPSPDLLPLAHFYLLLQGSPMQSHLNTSYDADYCDVAFGESHTSSSISSSPTASNVAST
jgi:hypothetical protein